MLSVTVNENISIPYTFTLSMKGLCGYMAFPKEQYLGRYVKVLSLKAQEGTSILLTMSSCEHLGFDLVRYRASLLSGTLEAHLHTMYIKLVLSAG